jgi:hypothetical protein
MYSYGIKVNFGRHMIMGNADPGVQAEQSYAKPC